MLKEFLLQHAANLNCRSVCILSLCRSSCTVTTWTASTSWSILRSCRRSSAGWCHRTIWARGRGRCWTTPTTRRPTTVRSPTPCRYKTWRETWRKTCPRRPWRGQLGCFTGIWDSSFWWHVLTLLCLSVSMTFYDNSKIIIICLK